MVRSPSSTFPIRSSHHNMSGAFLRGLLPRSRHFSRPVVPVFRSPPLVSLSTLRRPFWRYPLVRFQRLEQASLQSRRFLSTSPPSSSSSAGTATSSGSESEPEPTNKFLGRFDEVPLKDQRLSIQFTCTKCDTASQHTMGRIAFERGTSDRLIDLILSFVHRPHINLGFRCISSLLFQSAVWNRCCDHSVSGMSEQSPDRGSPRMVRRRRHNNRYFLLHARVWMC